MDQILPYSPSAGTNPAQYLDLIVPGSRTLETVNFYSVAPYVILYYCSPSKRMQFFGGSGGD
jgi:hypothetical protein